MSQSVVTVSQGLGRDHAESATRGARRTGPARVRVVPRASVGDSDSECPCR